MNFNFDENAITSFYKASYNENNCRFYCLFNFFLNQLSEYGDFLRFVTVCFFISFFSFICTLKKDENYHTCHGLANYVPKCYHYIFGANSNLYYFFEYHHLCFRNFLLTFYRILTQLMKCLIFISERGPFISKIYNVNRSRRSAKLCMSTCLLTPTQEVLSSGKY